MIFSTLLPLFFIVLVVGVLTMVTRERRRAPQTLTERANHPLRQFQIALNEPRKQAQRAAREEAQRAAREQEAKEEAKPERPPRSTPRRLKQV
ncbi:MAG: hypothetical protein ACRD0O_14195 [Acidimicrobiia bacterium]